MGLRQYRQETSPDEHDRAVTLAEERLGRKLSESEKRIDLVAQARDLKAAKALLVVAVQKEQARAARQFADHGIRPRLEVTAEMRAILNDLYDAGVEHATAELKAAGVNVGD